MEVGAHHTQTPVATHLELCHECDAALEQRGIGLRIG